MSEILKRPELLDETNRDFDFYQFDGYANNLYGILKSKKTPSTTVIMGGYGTGKSVLLNEIKKLSNKSKSKPKWLIFECWQYPDKTDLWEGFLVELVDCIEGKGSAKKALESYSNLTGWRKRYIGFSASTVSAVVGFLALVGVLWFAGDAVDDARAVMLSGVALVFLVLFVAVEVALRSQDRSSVFRLSDYKKHLRGVLKKNRKPVYIVLEDVDRAGELGRRFFETVAHYIKSNEFSRKNIKVIVPIADIDAEQKNRNSESDALLDSIQKAADNILHFKPSLNSEGFVREVLADSVVEGASGELITSVLNGLVGKSITIRDMKHLLRNAVRKHERLVAAGHDSLFELCFALECSKYMGHPDGRTRMLFESPGHFRHRQLYTWAQAQGIVNNNTDDEGRYIESRDFFVRSEDVFYDIRARDVEAPNRQHRGTQYLYNREYQISRVYFDDI